MRVLHLNQPDDDIDQASAPSEGAEQIQQLVISRAIKVAMLVFVAR